ncbi:glycosyltransferase [Lactococcus lactis subsp. lactis]|uniref:glycosyltransferase n=1 Tax=Lactococcus lactis TaxID=1358 RepID=UPI00129D7354|nr:glycosyltransferase [Lactococcus lactis]MRL66802.1 glycosyltransferase [Lactococcus lactis subsp. lactis]
MDKIKIVYLINSIKIGGPVNMIYNLVKNLDTQKFDITVIGISDIPSNKKKDFSDISCKVMELGVTGNVLSREKKVIEIINEISPAIVHSHGGIADNINGKLKKSILKVNTIHCAPNEDYVFKNGKILGNLKSFFYYNNLKKIGTTIACSKTVSDKIKSYKGVAYKYIQNGIDTQEIGITELNTSLKKRLQIKNSDTVFCFCGYLSKRKNVQYIISNFKKISNENYKLLIIGDGDELSRLKELASDDNRVIFVGRVSSPIEYLKISHYFLSASLSEGLPLAVMEGMACGLPAILSKIDSHIELSELPTNSISYFDLSDDMGLRNEIEKTQRNNYEQLSTDAKDFIENYLNAQKMAKNYEQIYLDILN